MSEKEFWAERVAFTGEVLATKRMDLEGRREILAARRIAIANVQRLETDEEALERLRPIGEAVRRFAKASSD